MPFIEGINNFGNDSKNIFTGAQNGKLNNAFFNFSSIGILNCALDWQKMLIY